MTTEPSPLTCSNLLDAVSEATIVEENPESSTATGPSAIDADAGPVCEKCGLPSDAAACPRCGWYPSLGIHVEIDESFERIMQNVPADNAGEAVAAAELPEWQKHLEVWKGVIPGWAWLMLGTTFTVVGAAIMARVVTIPSPTLQTYIGVIGLIAGLAVAAVTHLVGFILCSFEDADFGVFDLVIKPVKTWKKILSGLPHRLWLANSMNLGVTGALSAAFIVGGIPYERLLDWGVKARANQSLVAMIAEQAANAPGSGADNLEDAMSDFAGKGAGGLEETKVPTPPVAKPKKPLECLIIGFQATKDGKLRNLLLAAERYGKLKYVGKVKPKLDAFDKMELMEMLGENRSSRPFVSCPESGVWVRPRFVCVATHSEWERGKRPEDLEWEELLDEVKMPW